MKSKYKRREFLENVCPTVALAMFGVSLIEACSKGDDDSYSGSSDTVITGVTVTGNVVSIDLDDPSFSILQSRHSKFFFDISPSFINKFWNRTNYSIFFFQYPH